MVSDGGGLVRAFRACGCGGLRLRLIRPTIGTCSTVSGASRCASPIGCCSRGGSCAGRRSTARYVAVWHGDRVLVIRNSYRRLAVVSRRRPRARRDAARRRAARAARRGGRPRGSGAARLLRRARASKSSYAEDHAHVFELRCGAAPEVRVDRREVIWAEFLTPEDALARGVVGRRLRARIAASERVTRRAPPPPPPRTTPPRASSAGSPSAGARG